MDYKYLRQKVELEIQDIKSGHVWRYEINNIKPLTHIYKNGEYMRTVKEVNTPISEGWLEEIREGL